MKKKNLGNMHGNNCMDSNENKLSYKLFVLELSAYYIHRKTEIINL